MKRYRLTLIEKNDESKKRFCIYTNANSEDDARQYFENNYNRFNILIKITECK